MRVSNTMFVAGLTVMVFTGRLSAQAKTPAEEAKEIMVTRCAMCHGEKGDGAGPAAVALTPKPRNWSDAKWQKETPDLKIVKVIVEGGAAVGLNATMTANADLKGKDAVLKELVKTIRAFGAPSAPKK